MSVLLNADGGVLRAAGGATLSVPVTGPLEGTTLKGDGWSATLNSGWVVRPAANPDSGLGAATDPVKVQVIDSAARPTPD